MWKHCSTMHQGAHQEFKLVMVKKHHCAFRRQIQESVLISHGIRHHNLNSKSEWNGAPIPRLTVEVRDSVRQVDHDGEKLDFTAKRQ